ncbi:hypothetical protein JCM3774_006601 [Rhodotorula dairenensis]
MVRLSHHLFHSFAPVVLLTAYLVTILAFLAPTPILADHVYLMHVSMPVSAMAVTPGRHYIIGGGYTPRNGSQKQGMTKVVKRGPSVMVPVAIELQIGPLGACYTNVSSGGQECQSPSFTPIFSELYDDLSVPPAVVDTLVTQFPFSPTFLFISMCLMFIQLLMITSLAAGMHKPTGNLGFIARKQHRIVRTALIIGVVSLALGLAATGALRVVVGHDVNAAKDVQGVTADIGSGFAQLWAGYILQRPPSPASSPSTTSSPSPTLYRPPHARLSPSRPSANASWTNASRSPSPTLNRTPRLQSPLLEVHGDSFCGVFTLLGSECTVRRYSGASARGLNNPQSKQQVSQRLLDRLETARPHSVLLMFGAVDFAVNYLWQLKARGPEAVGPDDWTKKVICDYTAFLSDRIVPLARKCGTRLYVAGVLPPVVEDCYLEATADKYISISSTSAGLLPLAETAHPHDLATRMAMTRRYNSMLASYCSRFPDCFAFVDIGRDLVDRRDPLCRVAPEFLDPEDATNIHLLWETTLPFWMRALPPLAPLASRMSTAPELTRLGQSLAQYNQEKRERVRSRRFSWEQARPGTAKGHGLS